MVFLLCLTARTFLIRRLQIEKTDGWDTTAPLPIVCVVCCLLVVEIKVEAASFWTHLGGKPGEKRSESERNRERADLVCW